MTDTYLETRIKHIADEDLFRSLKLSEPKLADVRRAAAAGDGLAAADAWHAYTRKRLRNRPKGSTARAVTGLGPQVRDQEDEEVLKRADRVVARDIDCWGGIRIQYDGEIDFSRNLGGSSNYGFHYFGWITPLKAAYALTGDEVYARTFVEIFKQWYRQRDLVKSDHPGLDVIWYELGCNRVRVFRDHYFAMIDSEAFRDPEFHLWMLKSFLGHPRWLYRHQTEYRPGNWQIFGAQTLVGMGLSFPEFSEAYRWTRRGLKWILAHTRRDVHLDGCHRERAPHYHLGVVNSFWDVYNVLAEHRAFPRERQRIGKVCERMLEWTMGVMVPSGHSPTVGDSEYDIPQAQFLRVGTARRNGRLLWASQAPMRKIRQVSRALGQREPARPTAPEQASVLHPSSGFAVVRDRWDPKSLYVCVNYGPYGGGHSHSEALAFQMWAHGRPVAVDCGRGISYDDPLHRTWYTTVYAHNTVAVDGAGPSVKGRHGRLAFWETAGEADLLGLTHRGYREVGVDHRRCYLVNRKHPYAVVLDFLNAKDEHDYEWVLNTPEPVRARKGGAASRELALVVADPEGLRETAVGPATMALPLEGRTTWGMPREEGRNVRFRKRGAGVRYAVLVLPTDDPGAAELTVVNPDGRSPYRLEVAVAGAGFRHAYRVDCRGGLLETAV